jgi:preprotein translocase subunit SecG
VSILIGVLMFLTALFLILLVLVQRGRGGGLSGALGGMGGQSAFGTKAGDLFTRITMFVATFWILLCIAAILLLNRQTTSVLGDAPETAEFTVTPLDADDTADGPAVPRDPAAGASGAPATGTEAADGTADGTED